MKKVLFDTNVVLDVLLDRNPFAANAAALIAYVENKKFVGILGATTITTIDYLATKVIGKNKTKAVIENLFKLFEIASVNRLVLENALRSKFVDFEDAVLHEAALQVGAQAIITRNTADFSKAEIPIYTPKELLEMLTIINK